MVIYSESPCQIWMGNLAPYMTEVFITNVFKSYGDNPTRVKIMRDKNNGDPVGYCFIHFESEETARLVLHKLNNKIIPNTNPPVRFRLNYAGFLHRNGPEYSLFVGDLPPDVDDYKLYRCLAGRYRSVQIAKVKVDAVGNSKGYGFVRFSKEEEMKACIAEMNGYLGLGGKPIRVSLATPKVSFNRLFSLPPAEATVEGSYQSFPQPCVDPAAWQQYAWQTSYYHQQMMYNMAYTTPSFEGKDDMELIEHTASMNVDEMNQAVLSRDLDFWDSIESSKWSPIEMATATA